MLWLALFTMFLVGSSSTDVKYGNIQMPELMYVMPGETFTIPCSSDVSVITKIFVPGEEMPSERAKARPGANDPFRKQTTTTTTYENASKEEHEGIYTCIVNHGLNFDGPPYSEATCRVIIVDICAGNNCGVLETCVPNHSAGTYDCVCKFDCPRDYEPICADTCDFHYNECWMNEASCFDRIMRSKWIDGNCPKITRPTVRKARNVQLFEEDSGTRIRLSSGLINFGYPEASIQWTFRGEVIEAEDRVLKVVVSESTAGKYSCTITQCKDTSRAIVNHFDIRVSDAPTTVPPMVPTTMDPYFIPKPTCTVYPGGVVDTFANGPSLYDLSCSHVLAADLRLGWFIYGVFDKFQDQISLKSITFYIGRSMWEVTRGWIVHVNGDKLLLKESGLPREIPGTRCSATFENWHVKMDCPDFEAYYDGIMAGHIALKRSADENFVQKNDGIEFGLCHDQEWGWMTNWQVNRNTGECSIRPNRRKCRTGSVNCQHFSNFQIGEYGDGGVMSCSELTCDGNRPTAMQTCSLDLATAFSNALKNGNDPGQVAGASCPQEECDWFLSVVDKGCPQDTFPFQC